MQVIDLFAGVGGFSQGFINAGFDITFAVEYEKSIAASFKLNHPDTDIFAEDITQLDIDLLKEKYKNIDVVIGGPPCQGFSQKGKRLSLLDDRNYLFKYFIKFVEVFEPQYFVLENVPNITTTSSGFFKQEIIETFNKLGYEVDCKILLASNFGVPQDRRRAFFLGKKGKEKLFLPDTNGEKTTIKEAIYDLPFTASGEGQKFYDYAKKAETAYQKRMRIGSKGIYNHEATKHSALALERLSLIPKGKGKEVLPQEHRTKSIYSGTWCRLLENGVAATITTRYDTPSSGLFTHPILNRCITTREAARIQSFPDKFIFHGNKTSQMKQVGNAVPPLLAEAVANVIYKDYYKK